MHSHFPENISLGSDQRQKYGNEDKSTGNAGSFAGDICDVAREPDERVRRPASLVHTADFLSGTNIKCTASVC